MNIDGKILLLSCCAPCSCAVIEKLAQEKVDFAVLFYNPNIHPEIEYEKRRNEQKKICDIYGVPFVELEYNVKDWLVATSLFKDEPERGKRCSICFEFRLKRAMEYAKENGYKYVSSVLGVSRYKDLNQVNAAANKASMETNVPYLEIEGRKKGMQERRLFLIKDLNLYSQAYCGCVYSKQSAEMKSSK